MGCQQLRSVKSKDLCVGCPSILWLAQEGVSAKVKGRSMGGAGVENLTSCHRHPAVL